MVNRDSDSDRGPKTDGSRQAYLPKTNGAAWKASDSAYALAEFTHSLRFESLPKDVIHHGLLVIRDTIGTMLAGATLSEIKNLVQIGPSMAGPGQATLMGCRHSSSPYFAAFVNGTGAVTLELDEGNQFAVNHPSVHIFPAALALSEDLELSGKDLVTAFVAGYEVAVRMGRATRLRWPVHPFGTHAIVGAAACASKLMGLGVAQTAMSLDMAAGLCIASSQTAANSGASVRNLVTGLTNHNGLLAPMLIQAGFTGERAAFDVVFGKILGDSFEEEKFGRDLGSTFYITQNYFKMHACSRWNHAPIEAMARLMENHSFQIEDVDQIMVWTYDPATRLSWNEPVNGYAAKHSIPYNVAVRLIRGSNELAVYSDEIVSDPFLRSVAKKVKVLEDPSLTAMLPEVRPARVEIKLFSGGCYSETVKRPIGGFDNPYAKEQLSDKFKRLAGMILPLSSIEALEQMIESLPKLEDVRRLSPHLRNAQGAENLV